MAVVINEVDVVPAERAPEGGSAQQKGSAENSPPSSEEIERLVDEQISRYQRVRAY